MAPTNVYFDHDYREEQNLYEDIIIEALQIYGQETLYMPREVVRDDEILNEEFSRFRDAYAVEMYIENTSGFEGEGTLLSKFGLEIRDQATFIVSKRRFRRLVEINDNNIYEGRPREGDLIYLPLANSLFQIKFVEHEQPFYQLRNLPTYQLQCELYEYSGEEIETGIAGIDEFETRHGSPTMLHIVGGTYGFAVGDEVSQRIQDSVPSTARGTANVDVNTSRVTSVAIDDPGFGYRTAPTIAFPTPDSGAPAEATTEINDDGQVTSVTITDPGANYQTDVPVTFSESPADPIPGIVIRGEVSEFEETQREDPSQGQEREADLTVVNVVAEGSDVGIYTFDPEGPELTNDSQDDHPSDWSVQKVYDLSDVDKYISGDNDGFADNSRFEVDADDIIDFSESNPFGEPRD